MVTTRLLTHIFARPGRPAPAVTPRQALFQAVGQGERDRVQTLLAAHPGLIDALDEQGGTPLHLAAAQGYEQVARVLLAEGAEVDARDNCGATPLHFAVLHGANRVGEILLEEGANVNARTHHGLTPLKLARMYGQAFLAARLHQYGGSE